MIRLVVKATPGLVYHVYSPYFRFCHIKFSCYVVLYTPNLYASSSQLCQHNKYVPKLAIYDYAVTKPLDHIWSTSAGITMTTSVCKSKWYTAIIGTQIHHAIFGMIDSLTLNTTVEKLQLTKNYE